MSQQEDSTTEFDPMTAPQRYVRENRDDIVKLILQGDPFVRTVGLALLYKGGQKADIDSVIQELELLKQIDDDDVLEKINR